MSEDIIEGAAGFLERTVDSLKRCTEKPIVLFCCLAAATLAYRSYKIVPAQSYGVHVKFGQLKSDHVEPGFYFKLPLFESIDVFSNNTVIVESEVGYKGTAPTADDLNTSDRNPLSAKLRTHYRIDPAVGSIALKLPDLRGDNGEDAFQELELQSFDAVVGSRPAADTLADPDGFLKAYIENIKWRLAQNNMPIKVDIVELKSFHVDLNKPMQIRIKSDGIVEEMAGPAAVSVIHGGIQTDVNKATTVPGRPGDGKATISIKPETNNTPVQP